MTNREYKRNWMREWRRTHPQEALLQVRKSARNIPRKYVKEAVKKWRERNPEKVKAHRKIYSALRNGSIVKEPCYCGSIVVEAHHTDYSKPLQVIWVCKKHHRLMDSLRKTYEKA